MNLLSLSPAREFTSWLRAMVQLTKPRITRMVLTSAALGAVLAPGAMELLPWLWTMVGTALVVASANTLNMYLEHDIDALMVRTRERPLPSGRVSPEAALAFGILLGGAGLFVLGLLVNPLTGELAMMALFSYVLIYTPMKGVSSAALYLGAVPGALPPLLGYAGMHGALTPQAWTVFALMFVWQLPHFLAISVFRREEYAKAGLKVLPNSVGLRGTRVVLVGFSVLLWIASLAPWWVGLGGMTYAVLSTLTGVGFLAYAIFGRAPLETWARRLFFLSIPHLLVLLTTLAITAP